MPKKQNKRVFFAVNLPLELKKKILETFLEKLPEELNIVKAINLHITLYFLGYWPEEAIAEARDKLADFNFPRFEVKISKIGHFSSRVLWLGITKGSSELIALHSKLCKVLDLPFDNRFHPHITLARNRSLNYKRFREIVDELSKIKFEERFSVKSFELMESKLRSSGAEYKQLFSVKLVD
ncbi:MAG: RNA 2',3'-cyclic phosphodiesterase [Candidatus Diapherotrites archaeon]|nr:RNA 2',3'-cyclic phosphodiesterase [Candidatus Diapherotrites archaeon]